MNSSDGNGLAVALLDQLPIGVVVLNSSTRVVHYNSAEERLAGRHRSAVLGRRFFDEVAPCTNVRAFAGRFRAGLARGELDERFEFRFQLANVPRARDVRIHMRSILCGGELHGVLLVEDVAEELARARERDDFHALLVHDLRGNVAGILGFANLLASGDLGDVPASQREVVELVRDSASKLERTIAAALARWRGEPDAVALVPVNLHAIALAAVAAARVRAAALGIELRYEPPFAAEEFPTRAVAVMGDAVDLDRLLGNLLENALKHARRTVVVALAADAEVTLEVRDDGPGLEALPPSTAAGGSRLGLRIVAAVVERHGARLSADAAPEGGARFRVALPAAHELLP